MMKFMLRTGDWSLILALAVMAALYFREDVPLSAKLLYGTTVVVIYVFWRMATKNYRKGRNWHYLADRSGRVCWRCQRVQRRYGFLVNGKEAYRTVSRGERSSQCVCEDGT